MPYVAQQSVLEDAGLWLRQLAETPAGVTNGSNVVFTVDHKPLVDNNYSDTVTVDDVVAYVDGASVTVDSINATSGTITLNAAPAADTDVTIDYSYSPVASAFVAQVIEEAEDWIDTELEETVATPFSTVPKYIRAIARIYAAGLLMIRYYMLNDNGEQVSVGEKKLTMAEKMLMKYAARLKANGSDVGQSAAPSSNNPDRLFQKYNESEGRYEPLADENFTVNRES